MRVDLLEMQAHRLVVDPGQDQRRPFVGLGRDGAERVGRGVALVPRLARARSLARPGVDQVVLLAYAGLILEPDLQRLPCVRWSRVAATRSPKVSLNPDFPDGS